MGIVTPVKSVGLEFSRTMAMHEKVVMRGALKNNYSAELASPVPILEGRTVLYDRSYEHDRNQIVILGNDYHYRIYATLKIADLPQAGAYYLVDRINGKIFGGKKGYSAKALSRGVLIDIPVKEFRFLEVRTNLDGLEIEAFARADERTVRALLDKEKKTLEKQARYIEGFAQ